MKFLNGVRGGCNLVCLEETFGLAILLMEYQSFDEAIALTNDCQYGLGACLLTRDPLRAKMFFEAVKAGTVWINDPLTDNYAGPFGGMKLGGGARELGQEGLDEFRESQLVSIFVASLNTAKNNPGD